MTAWASATGIRWSRRACSKSHVTMHIQEARGVVHENCRIPGIPNLFIAGSSVFPTGGFANPTLTIVALALRLADHLKNRECGRAVTGV